MNDIGLDLRPIPGEPDYFCSSDGQIFSFKRHHQLRPLKLFPRDRTGHLGVNLTHNGKYKMHSVHRLIALAWLPPSPSHDSLVLHEDDNPANNASDNLRWGSSAKNSADMVSRGRQSRGVNRPLAKLSDADVVEIRRMAKTIKQRLLARKFGISESTMSAIILKKTWRHLNAD